MQLNEHENSPEACASLGLDCASCIQNSASSVAAICGGLDVAGVRQIFLQLYPAAGCGPMSASFQRAYSEHALPVTTLPIISKPVAPMHFASAPAHSAKVISIAAVA